MNKLQLTSMYHSQEENPLRRDRLLVERDGSAWLHPSEYQIISDHWDEQREEGTLIIEIDDMPACRFLALRDGGAPECWGFGNDIPEYLEGCPDGFAPELFCHWCRRHNDEYSPRDKENWKANRHGILELLPDLPRFSEEE